MSGRATFETLMALVERLVAAGFHPLTRWWRRTLKAWYRSGKKRLVVQAGRGSIKSIVLTLVAANEVLMGTWPVAPGERHYGILGAENLTEANGRLLFLEAVLRALGIEFTRQGDAILLADRPLGFRVLAARVGAFSGHRAVFIGFDEVAKGANDGAEPIDEVIASARAMTITHPAAREMLVSSPLAATGFFHDQVTAGDTDAQAVSIAATWVATDGAVTEEQCRKLEPDEKVFLREYAAQPQDAISGAFRSEHVYPAWCDEPLRERSRAVVIFDASGGGGDAWVNLVAQWAKRMDGTPVLAIASVTAFHGKFRSELNADAVAARIAHLGRGAGATQAIGDQFSGFALQSLLSRVGMHFRQLAWTNDNKVAAVARARMLFRDRRVVVAPGEESDTMRRQLLALEEKILPSGLTTFAVRRGHDDHALAFLLTCLADVHGLLHGSALKPSGWDNFAFGDFRGPRIREGFHDGPGALSFADFMTSPSARERQGNR